MFTAIPVSLMWPDSLYFLDLFILFWNSFHPRRLLKQLQLSDGKIEFPSAPTQRPSGLSVASFVVSLGSFSPVSDLPNLTFNSRLLAAAAEAPHSPQISALSSRPSSQSFSPSQSHCLAMHLFFEQANWFHRQEESAEGSGEQTQQKDHKPQEEKLQQDNYFKI